MQLQLYKEKAPCEHANMTGTPLDYMPVMSGEFVYFKTEMSLYYMKEAHHANAPMKRKRLQT